MSASINQERTIGLTFFASYAADKKTEAALTMRGLADKIETSNAQRKEWLPWVKMATFGDIRTANNSLRHDANVRAITGIEADYDGEVDHL